MKSIKNIWRELLANERIRFAILMLALYTFLLGIGLMGHGFKALGKGYSENLLATISDPITGVFIGLLATAIWQSSSATTSIIVTLCATGILPVETAIPAVMGANIGTTVTNILVSFGHMTRRDEFRRAVAGATVHDFFNMLSVVVLLPIELVFHPISRISKVMTDVFKNAGGLKFASPLKFIVTPVVQHIETMFEPLVGDYLGIFMIVIGLTILFIALRIIVDCTRRFATQKWDAFLNRYLFRTAAISFLLGLGLTAFVQSSSVTTSLIIPFVGAGLLTVKKIYPYSLGANIGTTITAILASLVTGSPFGVQIAFAHLMFNVLGCCIWYPLKRVPISLAERLGAIAYNQKKAIILFVIIAFYIVPVIYILMTRWL